jgi:hypothetical protein
LIVPVISKTKPNISIVQKKKRKNVPGAQNTSRFEPHSATAAAAADGGRVAVTAAVAAAADGGVVE